uniref:Signal peptidase I n=1 Tax=Prolemur simus TaxID=1328070 RepID=A0A8C8YH90_PROSS
MPVVPATREAEAVGSLKPRNFLEDVQWMTKWKLYYQVLNFGIIVSSALMVWKGLMVINGSERPFVRGDLLFLTYRVEDPIQVGEIAVFRIEGQEILTVHPGLMIHEKQNGHNKFLTKGDSNMVDDRGLHIQEHWLEKKDFMGRAKGFVSYVGIVMSLTNDYPKCKYIVLFSLVLFVLKRERKTP